jgi:hypothetical protein
MHQQSTFPTFLMNLFNGCFNASVEVETFFIIATDIALLVGPDKNFFVRDFFLSK